MSASLGHHRTLALLIAATAAVSALTGTAAADGTASRGAPPHTSAALRAPGSTAEGPSTAGSAAPHRPGGAAAPVADRKELAQRILGTGGITLATVHPGGTHAGSTARQNVRDTASGKGALTSPWSDKPNRRVALDTRMLNGMLKLRTQHGLRISVSEIVGGDHSSTSRHYAGLAFDVNYINGRHVGDGAPHRKLMAACRALGANQVLGPGDSGHSRHVHCAWPR